MRIIQCYVEGRDSGKTSGKRENLETDNGWAGSSRKKNRKKEGKAKEEKPFRTNGAATGHSAVEAPDYCKR
jgi:hypothetical protein